MNDQQRAEIIAAFEKLDTDFVANLRALRDAVFGPDLLEGGDQPHDYLPVPYRSQWDDDAKINASDCGPASLAMVLQWRGVDYAIDYLASECGMGAGKRYTTGGDLVASAAKHGIGLKHRFDASLDMIAAEIKAGRPVVELIHYGTLKPFVQDKVYTAGHWLVVIGITDKEVIVNDPNFRGADRELGHGLHIPRDVFQQAMADNKIDGNRGNQGVFVTP